jgi:hypothetical protein
MKQLYGFIKGRSAMTDLQQSDPESPTHPRLEVRESSPPELEEYAGGTIQARVGYIPVWLLVTYAVLFAWGLYYMYAYWGGVGPGRPG